MCTASLYLQFSVSVKFMRSRLCTYLQMFVNASRCLCLWYLMCHCWCMLIVVKIYVCIGWTPAVSATWLLMERHLSLLSHWGSAAQMVNGNIIVRAPDFATQFSFPPLGITIPWAQWVTILFRCYYSRKLSVNWICWTVAISFCCVVLHALCWTVSSVSTRTS